MEKELLVDIWRNPRSISELIISPFLYMKKFEYFRWITYLPELFVKSLFIFLPYFPAKNSSNKELNSSVPSLKKLFLICFFITALLSYGMVTIITFMEDRLEPMFRLTQTESYIFYNFYDDWANRLLYIAVVPAYIALSVVIFSISVSFQNQKSMRRNENAEKIHKVIEGTRPKFAHGMWQIGIMVSVVIIAAIWLSANYQNDVYDLLLCLGDKGCNDTHRPLLYWFLEQKSHGVTYNIAGFYYIILNFILLLTVIICVLYFYSSAFSVVGITKYIKEGLYDDFNTLSEDLRHYALLFVCAKWLFLALIINTLIWKASYLGKVQNLDTTIIAYGLIGSLLLPIPNYVIQTSWNLRQRKLFLSGHIKERMPNCVIFPRGWIKVAKNVANFFIALFFLNSAFGVYTFILNFLAIKPLP